jgi:ABC-type Zn uptake system ZnuABC Zn-binding protein ZnuA
VGRRPAQLSAGPGQFIDPPYVSSIGDLRAVETRPAGPLRIVAATTIVADVLAQVGRQAVDVVTLLPPGADPHGFVATPRQLAEISASDLVVLSGFGLEEGMGGVLEQVSADVPVVSLSEGIVGVPIGEGIAHEQEPEGGDEQHTAGGVDPHVWFDPILVMEWTRNAATALGSLSPAHREVFQENAEAYREALLSLDSWIAEQIEAIPPAQRVLVTDHFVFGYFARRYGFEIVGAVIPAYSSSASPSTQDLVSLLDAIEQHQVKAVFVGLSANPEAAETVAAETGAEVVPLYTESLSGPDGPAASYLALMRYDVDAIVQALR